MQARDSDEGRETKERIPTTDGIQFVDVPIVCDVEESPEPGGIVFVQLYT